MMILWYWRKFYEMEMSGMRPYIQPAESAALLREAGNR